MELIENGYFEDGTMDGWELCNGSLEGGITEENWVFLSNYNLELRGDDCVEYELPSAGWSTNSLGLWVKASFPDLGSLGIFSASVHYNTGDATANHLTEDVRIPDRPFNRPIHLFVPVDPERYIHKIQINTLAADLPWFVCGVSLDGEMVGASPGAKRLARGISPSERIEKVEKRLDRIYRILAMQKGPAFHKPKSPKTPRLKGKKAPIRKRG